MSRTELNFDILQLAQLRSSETGHTVSGWTQALELALQSLKFMSIDPKVLEQIAKASGSPETFVMMTRLMYRYGKSYLNGQSVGELIFEFTDKSRYSLSDWVDAIQTFHTWLGENKRKVDFLKMLNYLECVCASRDSKEGGQTLPTLLMDYLKTFGYVG
jgi:hypothetical protein